jgi:hypothetical protein
MVSLSRGGYYQKLHITKQLASKLPRFSSSYRNKILIKLLKEGLDKILLNNKCTSVVVNKLEQHGVVGG